MSYVDQVLQPGERVKVRATIHWATYLSGLVALGVAALVYVLARLVPGLALVLDILALLPAALGLVLILRAWFRKWGTEIAVTDHRVIYKVGVVSRRTLEMHVDQIESVEVEQSILGRILGYGDIILRGSGDSTETIRLISEPLAVRSAITAR